MSSNPSSPNSDALPGRSYLAIAFFVGFTSLVYEVYSAKILFLYFVESTHAVAVTLSAFLAGLGTSALVCSRFASQSRRRAHAVVAWLLIASTTYALLVLRRHEIIPDVVDLAHRAFGTGLAGDVSRVLFSWLYLFLPGLFIGGAFPILTGLFVSDFDTRTRAAGVVYFWDTVGAIAGALAAGFLLLPWLGLKRAVLVPSGINLLVAAALLERRFAKGAAGIAGAGCIGLAFYPANEPAPLSWDSALRTRPKGIGIGRFGSGFGRIVAQEQSPFGLVTVGDDAMGREGDRAMFIGWRDMCHSVLHGSETALANNTVTQLGPGARVLNIGLGCGFTAGAIAGSSKVAALEIAEINPVIARMAREHFGHSNGHVLDLEKTRLFIQDGAELIRESPRTYDAVVVDIEEPTVIHSSPLYTREYFEIIRRKLSPKGLLALWLIGQDRKTAKVIWNTLRTVFQYVEVRVPESGPVFSFYGSIRFLDLPEMHGSGEQLVRDMTAMPIDDVNTIDNRALERYFHIRRAFSFPNDYDEPVLTDAERARGKASRATREGESG
jgi:spermidine synthase